MDNTGSNPTIFLRPCFACGNPMTIMEGTLGEGCVPWLECRDCEVIEIGTVQGRWHYMLPEGHVDFWDGSFILYADHSKTHLPSPDMLGSQAEPVTNSPWNRLHKTS